MKQKHAAMEMSVGTIVTIVLLMSVLVLGLVMVQKIFSGSTNAIDEINNRVIDKINEVYADETIKLAVSDQNVELKKGDSPKGFAFDVKNKDVYDAKFTYNVYPSDVSRCGSLTKAQADNFLIGNSGSFSLGPGDRLEHPRLVKFSIPEGVPSCTIIYILEVKKGTAPYSSIELWVTIK